MAKPLPLPVWDRHRGTLVQEWMDDHKPTYESEPRRSITQWIKSQPLYDWFDAAYQNTQRSARQIEPFIRKYHIDMSEFEPLEYRSFAEFFDRRFRPAVRKFPSTPGEMGAFAEASDDGKKYFEIVLRSLDRSSTHSLLLTQNKRNAASRLMDFHAGAVVVDSLEWSTYSLTHG